MKTISLLFIFSILAWPVLETEAAESSPAPVSSPYAPVAFLVGGTWHGELPPGPNGAKGSIELVANWAANHQGIRFDGEFVVNGKRSPYTSGIYCWNAGKKQLVFMYTDSEGSLTEGSVTIENGALVHEFTTTDPQGKMEKARAIITPRGADSYTNEIFIAKDGKWERKVEVHYERTGAQGTPAR